MFRALVAFLALVAFAGTAQAGDKVRYAPAPAWVKPAPAIDVAKLTDADPVLLVLDQQQRLDNGEVWAYFESASRIASPQLLTQAGTLSVPWDPSKGDLIIHKIEILRGSERIDVLAKGARLNVLQREQQLEQAALNGMLTGTMAIAGLRVGDVLRGSFSITRRDPTLQGHVQTSVPLLPEPTILKFGRARLLWRKETPIQLRSYLKGAEPQPVDTPDGWREVSITLPAPKPAETPDDAPLRYRPLPALDAASYADWAEVSKRFAPLYRTEGAIAPGSPLAAEVARIAAASSDPRTRVAMALQLVQDKIRYLFRGMDNGNYVPQTPDQTWSLRYGDCKAKSLLLLALLRGLGIEAEAALVSADMGDYLTARLPMPGAFNHVIVRATVGGETLWLDGTGGGARLADLADVPAFRNALPLREAGAGLAAMPLRPDSRPAIDAEIEIDSSAGEILPMPYRATVTVRGGTAELLRVAAVQAAREQRNQIIDMTLGRFVGNGKTIDRVIRYDEASATATITARGVIYANWVRDAGRMKLQLDSVVDGLTFKPDRGRAAWREIPVAVTAVDDRHVRLRVKLANGGRGYALEGDQVLPDTLATAALQRSVKLEGEWITLDDRITNGIREVAPGEIPAVRGQVTRAKARLLKVAGPADLEPNYRQVAAARAAKKIEPMLAVFDAAVAEEPDEVDRYTDRAWFHEQVYDRAAAIRDLDKALELSPSVDSYLWRARLRAALKDDKGAVADARAALELDPSSAAAISQVATLDAKQGRRAEAIALLEEHAGDSGKDGQSLLMTRAFLLGDDGRAADGIALLDDAIVATPGQADLLNARCWLKGTRNLGLASAIRDCTRSIELSENPEHALDSRAMVYFRMNRIEEAVADLNAAIEAAPEQAGSLFLRGVIGKRQRTPDAEQDLVAARTIDPRIDEEYAGYGIRP